MSQTQYTPTSTRIRWLKSQYTKTQVNTALTALQEAISSGATTLTLPGLSGSVSLEQMERARIEYEAVWELYDAECNAANALLNTPAPAAHSVNFGCRPIGF